MIKLSAVVMVVGVGLFFGNMLTISNQSYIEQNVIDKAFLDKKDQQFSWWEKRVGGLSNIASWFGGKPVEGGEADLKTYAGQMKMDYVTSSTDTTKNMKNQSMLAYEVRNLWQEFGTGKSLERDRKLSILNELMGENNDMMKLSKKSTTATPPETPPGIPTKDEKMGSIESNRAGKNIYITIDKLIEKQIISTTNLKESLPEIKSLVTAAMIEAVNDINHNI